ncbi:hypothetical protein [Falsiroseomonas sp. HW251]|uniref:hypothetical protein n=1 Tax=Falsiroseomonas sp. HW251 TaxID=3390998 RepID=UPI003D31B532
MFRRTLCALPLLVAGCAAPNLALPALDTPAPPPPRRASPVSLGDRLRQEPWMARFWSELSPAQRRRVLGLLKRREPSATEETAAPAWDAMGLPARETLLYGPRRVVSPAPADAPAGPPAAPPA